VWGGAPWVLSGGSTSWRWDFGGGETSLDQNPSHTYTKAGTHTVTFTARNEAGAATITKDALISVSPGPVHRVELQRAQATVATGEERRFTVAAYGRFGNPVTTLSLQWQAREAGTIDQEGVFMAGTIAGSFKDAIAVRAMGESGEVLVLASVTIKAGPLDRVVLSPDTVTLPPGGVQQFSARANSNSPGIS
jgi:PKD repeat protein